MTETIKPILWHQGLFLQPQHFQQNDFYHNALLDPLRRYLSPYLWGIADLRIDEPELKNSVFEILQAEILFPDGTLVKLPGNARCRARSFKDRLPEPGRPLKVFAGLRKWDRSGGNIATGDPAGNPDGADRNKTRFMADSDSEEVADLYQSGPAARIKFMEYSISLFWESELNDAGDYLLIPVASLENDGTKIDLSRTFIPPSITATASPVLAQWIRSIREQTLSRARVLEEFKVPKGTASDIDSGYIIYLLALRSLNRYVPLLHHWTENNTVVHPWTVYGLLRQLVGELSSFSERIDMLGRLKDGSELLPPYDHEDLGHCFGEAHLLIEELLGTILVGAENIVYLIREGDFFRSGLANDFFDSRNHFYLILKSSGTPQAVSESVLRVAKLGCNEEIPTLIRRALPGLGLEEVLTLPPGLPVRKDCVYFRMDRGTDHWLEIQRNQNICLHWAGAPEDAEAQIVIIRK